MSKRIRLTDIKGRKYLLRIIWLTCLCVSLPILICGLLFYRYLSGSALDSFLEEKRLQMQAAGERIDSVLGGIELSSFTLASFQPITKLGNEVISSENTTLWGQVLNKIAFEKNLNGYIEQAAYYNRVSGVLVSDSYGYAPLWRYPERERFAGIGEGLPAFCWISGKGDGAAFVRRVPQLADGAGFIVLDTKLDALRSIYLQSRGQYGAHANLLVLDKSGALLFSAKPAGEFFGADISGDEAAARILESSGPLLEAGGRGYYQVTHKSALGYTYCSVTEKSAVDKAVSWVALFVRFAVLLPLAIGLVLSGVCVFSLYRPVNTLLAFGGAVARRPPRGGGNEFAYFREIVSDLQQQSDSLREHIETMRPDLRARLLSGFLRGEWDNGDHGLAKKCAENGICVDGAYVVMLIDMGQRQKPETLRLALTAVRSEIPPQNEDFQIHAVMNGEAQIAVAVRAPEEIPPDRLIANLFAYAGAILTQIGSRFGVEAAIGIGRPSAGIFGLSSSYAGAVQALKYQICQNSERILYIADMEKWQLPSSLQYPRATETDILNSLRQRDIGAASLSLDKFLESIGRSKSEGFIRQSLYLFLSNVIFSFDEKESKLLEFLRRNLFEQLETLSTADQMAEWFKTEVFTLYLDLLEDSGDQDRALAVRRICRYIAENVSFEISLTHCAEMAGMSPSYFSKIFKLETGQNFLDYVVMCKVEKAKLLLAETDSSICEISRRVGYSERNFYRVFLKLMEMSPSEFREQSQPVRR